MNIIPADYAELLQSLKEHIRTAQAEAYSDRVMVQGALAQLPLEPIS